MGPVRGYAFSRPRVRLACRKRDPVGDPRVGEPGGTGPGQPARGPGIVRSHRPILVVLGDEEERVIEERQQGLEIHLEPGPIGPLEVEDGPRCHGRPTARSRGGDRRGPGPFPIHRTRSTSAAGGDRGPRPGPRRGPRPDGGSRGPGPAATRGADRRGDRSAPGRSGAGRPGRWPAAPSPAAAAARTGSARPSTAPCPRSVGPPATRGRRRRRSRAPPGWRASGGAARATRASRARRPIVAAEVDPDHEVSADPDLVRVAGGAGHRARSPRGRQRAIRPGLGGHVRAVCPGGRSA